MLVFFFKSTCYFTNGDISKTKKVPEIIPKGKTYSSYRIYTTIRNKNTRDSLSGGLIVKTISSLPYVLSGKIKFC